VLFRRPAYFLALRGAFSGFFEMCRIDGKIEQELSRLERRASFTLRW
jgi:hypothetical protein